MKMLWEPDTEVIYMNGWNKFLNSLSTTGGDIFVLVIVLFVFLVGYSKTGDNMMKESITLILGALLGLLRGKSNQKVVEIDKNPLVEQKTEEK